MALDPTSCQPTLFGGDGGAAGRLADTWELVSCPPSFTALGQGCQGSHGKAPVLSGLEPPSLGLTFHLGLTAAPPLAPSLLFFDITDPAVDLTPFGATGCWARVNPGFISLYLPVSLTGTWHPAPFLAVPYETALLGAAFYAQAFLLDAGANPLGLITSNGLKGVVGF